MDDVELWTIDTLTFGTTVDGCYWVVDDPVGWESGSSPRSARTPKPTADGSYRGPNWRAEKVYVLNGWVDVPDEVSALRVRDQLAAVCGNEQILYPLRHTDARSGEDRVAFVELDGEPFVRIRYDQRPLTVEFSLQLAAPDPQRYSATLYSKTTKLAADAPGGVQWNGPAGTTGIEWNGPSPGNTGVRWQDGAGENGVVSLTNKGTGYSPVILQVAGPVLTPIIERTDTGEVIQWGGTVPAGSVLEVNTGTGSVRLDGGNQRPLLVRADFFKIPPDATIDVAFRSPTPSPTAQLTAVWPDAWK